MTSRRIPVSLSGSAASAVDLIPSTPCEAFSTFSVQITGTFVATVQWQGSIDGTTWVALRAQDIANATSILGATSTPGMFRGALGVRFFRLTCTAYTSGTIVGTVLLHPESIPTVVKST